MLYFCGFEVLSPFVAWGAAHLSDAERQDQLTAYRERLLALDTAPRLPFHPLADYDENLQLTSQ